VSQFQNGCSGTSRNTLRLISYMMRSFDEAVGEGFQVA